MHRNGTYDVLPRRKHHPIRDGKTGYVRLFVGHDHPMANITGHCFVHRLVMAEYIGRSLHREETVHHVNGIRDDNRIENLELWAKNHGAGQRVIDLVDFVIERYGDLVSERLADNAKATA